MKPKIATIMSVYAGDNATQLRSAIESIINQSFSQPVDSRIYLAIDGPISHELNSTIEEYRKKIHLIYKSNTNKGLATTLNALINKLEDEEFIFRMDADDLSYTDRYQSQLDYLQRFPDIDILGTDIVEVDMSNGSRRHVTFCKDPEDAISRLCMRVPVAHPTVCFRRHVIDRVGGYPLTGTNEDVALWFRCAKEGFKFDNVKRPLLDFSINQNFWKRRSYKKAFSELRCYTTGIWQLDGVTWKYMYPIARFAMRIAPNWLSRRLYNSKIRLRR